LTWLPLGDLQGASRQRLVDEEKARRVRLWREKSLFTNRFWFFCRFDVQWNSMSRESRHRNNAYSDLRSATQEAATLIADFFQDNPVGTMAKGCGEKLSWGDSELAGTASIVRPSTGRRWEVLS
jgi:hypothetical protein